MAFFLETGKISTLRVEAATDLRPRVGSRALRCAWCLHWISRCRESVEVSHGLCGTCLGELRSREPRPG
ncbi:MAG: hypothetical protein VCB99_02345 [Myxococcota bacterium]